MNKSKIEWCDHTWNPITGCRHNCSYCYARRMTARFAGDVRLNLMAKKDYSIEPAADNSDNVFVLEEPMLNETGNTLVYPFGFEPTYHKYRMDYPEKLKMGNNIFVGAMADIFGKWVPDEWIEQVFEACEAAPQHRYLFLTKNPKRYVDLYGNGILRVRDSFWYGSTITGANEPFFFSRMPDDNPHTFCSIEPIIEPVGTMQEMPEWVIVGAETGTRKGKVAPRKEWIDEIAAECRRHRKPLFMKDSLHDLMGDDFKQEFPWEVK